VSTSDDVVVVDIVLTSSGAQVYDNKGRVVEKYEPFFAVGWDYAEPSDAQLGQKAAMVYDPRGQVIASSSKGPEVSTDLAKLPQVAAQTAPVSRALEQGTGADGHSVLSASSAVPKLGWVVFFEQPTAQALAPIRDQILRVALLIGVGLAVAILAGILLARRMLIPITALRTGARRLGAGDFSHRIDVHTRDELEELADQFNSMAGQLHETYSVLETKVEERTRDLARSIKPNNLPSMLGVGVSQLTLVNYLLGQLRLSKPDRVRALREFAPSAVDSDWDCR